MTDPSPTSQTFTLKRRGQNIAMAVIFLVIAATCFVQTVQRLVLHLSTGFASWWFFLLIGLGFTYLTVESAYKAFGTRLVLDAQGFVLRDFLKVTTYRWDQVAKVAELDMKSRNRKDYGIFLKEDEIRDPGVFSMPFISLLPFFEKWNDDPIQLWFKTHQPRLLKRS